MYDYLLGAVICLCLLPAGQSTEDCSNTIVASRGTMYVPEGDELSLSCDIQHCGDTWTGNWMQKEKKMDEFIENSDRHRVTNVTLSANTTRLVLTFLSVNQSDEGSYGCMVKFSQGATAIGHYTYLNITTAVPKRKLWHRLLICACASLCPFLVLGLARCLRSEVKPQPLPRSGFIYRSEYRNGPHSPPKPPPRCPVPKKRSNFPYRAPARSEQRTELVYADISKDALRQQEVIRQPTPSTVYSSVRFP